MPVTAGIHHLARGPEEPGRPPVILLHGAGGTLGHWPPEIRRLPDWRVLAVDLPGHGSSPGPGLRSISGYARRVADLLDALGLAAAVVVGHSMGGAVALSLALDQPARVAGLGLVSTGARLRVAPAILEQTASAAAFPQAVEAVTGGTYGPRAGPALREEGARRLAATPPEVVHGDFLACDAFDVMARLGDVRAPALVVCGTEDRFTPPKYAAYLRDHLPAASLETVEGAGHMVMLEEPRAVARALAAFLAAHW